MADSNAFSKLTEFLKRLSGVSISFMLRYIREDSVMVFIDVPGERWEVEFFVNVEVEVERFLSRGDIEDERALGELFDRFSD